MSDFTVMQKLSDEDEDIRATNNLIRVKKTKRGGEITFGVDEDSFKKLCKREFIFVMYLIDTNQYIEAKRALSSGEYLDICVKTNLNNTPT